MMNFLQRLVSRIFGFKIAETVSPGAGEAIVKQGVEQTATGAVADAAVYLAKLKVMAIKQVNDLADKLIASINKFVIEKAFPVVAKAKQTAADLKAKDKLGLTMIPELKAYFDKVDGIDAILTAAQQTAIDYVKKEQAEAIANINAATSEESINRILASSIDVITKSEVLILKNIMEKVTIF